MSTSGNESKGADGGAAVKYATEKLLKSRALSGYQRDFAQVILTEAEYTIEDAKKALDEALARKEEA